MTCFGVVPFILSGHVVMWSCGHLAMWSCGHVVMWSSCGNSCTTGTVLIIFFNRAFALLRASWTGVIICFLMDGCFGGSSSVFFFMGKMRCHLALGSLGVLSLKCAIHASTSGL